MKKRLKLFGDMWKADYQFKTLFLSALSAIIGIGFAVFNAVLGILYQSVWNGSICVYYVLLAIVRGIVVYSHKRPEATDEKINRKIYIGTHLIMLFMDVSLIAPIAYMVTGERRYEYGMIPAITMAVYTTYRVAMGILNFLKSRKQESILVKELRIVNLQDSLVALLTLQNALITASGSGIESMTDLTVWTSAGIWLAIMFFTVKSFLDLKIRK